MCIRDRVEAALDDVPAGVEGDGGGQFVEGHVAQVVATGDAAIGRQPAEAVGWAEAVSYTHLDVYKRQTSWWRAICAPSCEANSYDEPKLNPPP